MLKAGQCCRWLPPLRQLIGGGTAPQGCAQAPPLGPLKSTSPLCGHSQGEQKNWKHPHVDLQVEWWTESSQDTEPVAVGTRA